MATNKRIQEQQKKQKARQWVGNIKFANFMNRFKEMKDRQGWNYQRGGV